MNSDPLRGVAVLTGYFELIRLGVAYDRALRAALWTQRDAAPVVAKGMDTTV